MERKGWTAIWNQRSLFRYRRIGSPQRNKPIRRTIQVSSLNNNRASTSSLVVLFSVFPFASLALFIREQTREKDQCGTRQPAVCRTNPRVWLISTPFRVRAKAHYPGASVLVSRGPHSKVWPAILPSDLRSAANLEKRLRLNTFLLGPPPPPPLGDEKFGGLSLSPSFFRCTTFFQDKWNELEPH